ncbi:MAG TPA: UPF0182 family protein, partial [Firmicutes bacterium]|nr:UPF0182 family protein [Bacillota bacterium]
MTKRRFGMGLVAALLVIAVPVLVRLWTSYLWFREVGYTGIFSRTLTVQMAVGTAFFLVTYLFLSFTLTRSYGSLPGNSLMLLERFLYPWQISRVLRVVTLALALFLAVTLTRLNWQGILLFLNRVPFGVKDPIFGRDVGFYVFLLPLLTSLYHYLSFLLLLAAGAELLLLFTTDLWRTGQWEPLLARLGKYVLGLLVLILFGFQLRLFSLVYSPRGVAFGASYTDIHVTRPYYYLASVVVIAAFFFAWRALRRGDVRHFFQAALAPVAFSILGFVVALLVQFLVVSPNEIALELPYLENNIAFTRRAFALDRVKELAHPGKAELTWADLTAEPGTVKNIRINDFRPAQTVLNQLQAFRLYYQFPEVDVDRYTLGGRLTEVFLAGRELNPDALTPQAKTWVNQLLKYTHGYGVVAAPVNETTPEGLPRLIVRNIPPVADFPELAVQRPQIYFGRLTTRPIVVKSREKEFDHPMGENNVEAVYEGRAGIPLGGLNRLLFAFQQRSLKLLVSGSVTGESRILLHREIFDRVSTIAPFFTWDPDPYLVIAGGRLYWIVDGYTASDRYPYSQPVSEPDWAAGVNYLRNSVKVTIDAYDGTTTFYLADPSDPLAQAFGRAYPGLFKPLGSMPQELKAHLHYPQGFFAVQASAYTRYHMKNPRVFYNNEDAWNIATEIFGENQQPVEPYYVILRLPDETKEEFVLMQPFTPINKQNMVGWLAARMDPGHYGELLAFRFPKDRLVYGPMQIESRIDQDPNISRELTLWGQRGSRVIRGNLLVIPLRDSVLYVEPIYIQADNPNSLPEVQRVVAAQGDRLTMAPTLEEALRQIVLGPAPTAPPPATRPTPTAPVAPDL